ncbi:hypothetical protein SMSK23_1291 [Streptococcus oralis ATCC 35037]|nr:hypothetical protein [Streptococcus oralis]EFO01864.1 hypothetical protein SMSK23_1291 [Streptococcus oralis ATCC 35037]
MKKILKHSALLLSALALVACGAQKKQATMVLPRTQTLKFQ